MFGITPLEFNVSTDSLDGEAPMEASTHVCALQVTRDSGQEWPVMSLRSKEGFGRGHSCLLDWSLFAFAVVVASLRQVSLL